MQCQAKLRISMHIYTNVSKRQFTFTNSTLTVFTESLEFKQIFLKNWNSGEKIHYKNT